MVKYWNNPENYRIEMIFTGFKWCAWCDNSKLSRNFSRCQWKYWL